MTFSLTVNRHTRPSYPKKWVVSLFALIIAIFISGCASNAPKFTLGGTLYGLPSGANITLELNSANPLPLTSNGAFTFTQQVEKGKPYTITISTQPSGGYCTLNNSTGTVGTADIANTVVTCDWTWVSGTNVTTTASTYPAAPGGTGTIGGRSLSATWTDSSGNLWIMGGFAAFGGGLAMMNDLWEFNPKTSTWTYLTGSENADPAGIYPATVGGTGTPGGRYEVATTTDSSGNLWLFGGFGYDSTGARGDLNDLWKYSVANNTWTWVSGSNLANTAANYPVATGSTGTPGGREVASIWADASGNIWLFGGSGYDKNNATGELNDLWKYSTTNNTWTWIGGSATADPSGTYPANIGGTGWPGGNCCHAFSVDAQGNAWLFGGYGLNGSGNGGYLNDLWEYSPTANTWTWVSGSNAPNTAATYPAALGGTGQINGLLDPNGWIDSSGKFWVFGGEPWTGANHYTNALWYFDTNAKTWTWVNGDDTLDPTVPYPSAVGDAGTPPARCCANQWHDYDGNFWIFSGYTHYNSTTEFGNDLWEWQN